MMQQIIKIGTFGSLGLAANMVVKKLMQMAAAKSLTESELQNT